MKTEKIKHKDDHVFGFPYQMTDWFKDRESLDCYIEPFVKYNDESYGRIVKSPVGYSIYTKGQRYKPASYVGKPKP